MVTKAIMVVARYNEDLNWLKDINIPHVIYNKGEDDLPDGLENVIKLENVGREAQTYLQYIVDNYNELPDKVYFCQGEALEHSPELKEIIAQDFNFTTAISRCHLWDKKKFGLPDIDVPVAELINVRYGHVDIYDNINEKAFGKVPKDVWISFINYIAYNLLDFSSIQDTYGVDHIKDLYIRHSYGAHYLVMREDILSKSIAFWEKLLDLVSLRNTEMKEEDCYHLPWILEAVWYTLLFNPAIKEKAPAEAASSL
jgi:hypothetical protein